MQLLNSVHSLSQASSVISCCVCSFLNCAHFNRSPARAHTDLYVCCKGCKQLQIGFVIAANSGGHITHGNTKLE